MKESSGREGFLGSDQSKMQNVHFPMTCCMLLINERTALFLIQTFFDVCIQFPASVLVTIVKDFTLAHQCVCPLTNITCVSKATMIHKSYSQTVDTSYIVAVSVDNQISNIVFLMLLQT